MPEPAASAWPAPLVPLPYRVTQRRRETDDAVSLRLEPLTEAVAPARPGQFNMLSAPGVGECAISVSGSGDGAVDHTVRDVGAVTHALCEAQPGTLVGVRGPFGTDWGVDQLLGAFDGDGPDVVVVAGGIGLAPLRLAVDEMAARRRRAAHLRLVVGARSPDQLMFTGDLQRWRDSGVSVTVTVDQGTGGWRGPVGVVTEVLPAVSFDPDRTVAMVCGPEVMMRFVARALVERGVSPAAIKLSLERNMQCGLGWCGHCQLGELLVCRDGPVVAYGGLVEQLLAVRER
ncbi:MAG TPA: FAD/NAD(P)-binding protein [Acidimicrobiales bacterium]|nr:FAD/NAD(P)-binding protein [Acidimicrobiales bacterium]